MPTRHYTVHGRVQGVCFRASTQQHANHYGLSGWVRNLPDGAVELACSGTKAELDALESWLHQGPEHARVDRLDITELQGEPEYQGVFEIIY